MPTHASRIQALLANGPASARQLLEKTGISQPTLSRTLSAMGHDVVRMGAARSIRYALRDRQRGVDNIPVYRVSTEGSLRHLGTLAPVRPDGFVMQQTDGVALHSDSLPWWLQDMRPQGYLGRAYVAGHAQALGLPSRLSDWNDTHVLRALLAHGHDAVGNLLLGDLAREHFIQAPPPTPIEQAHKRELYVGMAQASASGELPGSSAGGEQPKFAAYVTRDGGAAHVLVKFSLPDDNPITQRWRDLLLAEHLALETLLAADIPAVRSQVFDHAGQRFLELERFDRVGPTGRCGVFSLAALEAEFVGQARAPWPVLVAQLAHAGQVLPEAAEQAALLYAYGVLIGNTDMHNGNLSFVSEHGRPYSLAPAYDMLPMAWAPSAGGGLPQHAPPLALHPSVPAQVWRQALVVAHRYIQRVQEDGRFSTGFEPALQGLRQHLHNTADQVARLA